MEVLQEIDLKTLVSEKILNDWEENDLNFINTPKRNKYWILYKVKRIVKLITTLLYTL